MSTKPTFESINVWRIRNGLPPMRAAGESRSRTGSGNSLTISLDLPKAQVDAFASAIGELPEGIRGKFVRKAVNKLGTRMRAAMRVGARAYRRSGGLERSMTKKTIYFKNGNIVILAGPSRRFVTQYSTPRGVAWNNVVPWRYAHLPEFGTESRRHTKGRQGVYVPWLERTYSTRRGNTGTTNLKGQSTGRVTAKNRITMAVRSAIPVAISEMGAEVEQNFRKWWDKTAPKIGKKSYIPRVARENMGTDSAIDM